MRLHLCLLFCLHVPKNADACTQSCIQTPAHFDIHTCTHMHAHMYTGTRTHKGMHPWMSMQKTHVHIGKHSCYYIALDECNPKLLIDFRHTTASPCPFACSPSVQHSTTIAALLSCVCEHLITASQLAILPNIFSCVLPSVWSLGIVRPECHARGGTLWAAGGDQVPVS